MLPVERLWGISFGGACSRNIAGQFAEVLRILDRFPNLSVLHLDSQKATEDDLLSLVEFLTSHPKIVEVSVDDTAISTDSYFFQFYNKLFGRPNLAIGRPFIDVPRLIGILGNRFTQGKQFSGLQAAAEKPFGKTPQFVRVLHTWLKERGDSQFDSFHSLAEVFPRCFAPVEATDAFRLNRVNRKQELQSLTALLLGLRFRTPLSALQSSLLPSELRPPTYFAAGMAAGEPQTFEEELARWLVIERLERTAELRRTWEDALGGEIRLDTLGLATCPPVNSEPVLELAAFLKEQRERPVLWPLQLVDLTPARRPVLDIPERFGGDVTIEWEDQDEGDEEAAEGGAVEEETFDEEIGTALGLLEEIAGHGVEIPKRERLPYEVRERLLLWNVRTLLDDT
jgi:hypothetical protein